jgi:hypothetical protein
MPQQLPFKLYRKDDKGDVIQEALEQAGHTKVSKWRDAGMIWMDHDQRWELRRIQQAGKPVFIYPHSARSMILWDGIIPSTSAVKCNFVFGKGSVEVMKRYGYKRPVEAIGWTYSPVLPFTPSKEIRKILFAPIHPNRMQDPQGRRLMEHDQSLNRKVVSILRKIPSDVTIRYGGNLEDNGLKPEEGFKYSISDLTIAGTIQAIQDADIVIGHQTFAYLSVALGKPTVMFGEDTIPHSMQVCVRSWDCYKDLLMFPFDLLQGDPMRVLEEAASTDRAIQDWKQNFIGEPFDAAKFSSLVEKYIQ